MGTQFEDGDLSGATISDFFRYLAADAVGAAARKDFCRSSATRFENLAAWLAVDAWLGAGDTEDTSATEVPIDPERGRAFMAASLVAQMTSELISGAVLLLENEREYAFAGLIRQLIECEYLFRAFQLDFSDATKWLDALPSAKQDFSPANLRKLGGFDHAEYSRHCEAGGHPRAAGRYLLPLPRAMAAVGAAKKRDCDDVNLMLWMDFALHCDRAWLAFVQLLAQEHARFLTVRGEAVHEANAARVAWHEADLLAREIGPILGLIERDPGATLTDVLREEPNDITSVRSRAVRDASFAGW